jgi:hypothetical protein
MRHRDRYPASPVVLFKSICWGEEAGLLFFFLDAHNVRFNTHVYRVICAEQVYVSRTSARKLSGVVCSIREQRLRHGTVAPTHVCSIREQRPPHVTVALPKHLTDTKTTEKLWCVSVCRMHTLKYYGYGGEFVPRIESENVSGITSEVTSGTFWVHCQQHRKEKKTVSTPHSSTPVLSGLNPR